MSTLEFGSEEGVEDRSSTSLVHPNTSGTRNFVCKTQTGEALWRRLSLLRAKKKRLGNLLGKGGNIACEARNKSRQTEEMEGTWGSSTSAN